jgi:tetratricopeptide (TPR) repeat protein
MTATEDGIKVASDYMKLIRQELTDTSVSIIFGQLFLQMGNYPMAQKYFFHLLKNSKSDDQDFPSINYHLALTDGYQGNLHEAEDRLKQVFQCHISLKSNHLQLARTKNALGWIYHHSGELDDAMTYYQEALAFAEERIGLNHLINAQTCSLLGDCYLEKLELNQAEMYYRQALEIECLHLPNNHPRIGVTYNHLGNVFRKRKDMKEAMKYYEQAELIFGQRLPSHHPYTAYCWSCMAFVYLYEGEIKKAQEYHEKALEIYRRILPSDHINIKISEKNSKCTDFQKINDTYVKICAQV